MIKNITIETGVPVTNKCGGRKRLYEFGKLQNGESMFVSFKPGIPASAKKKLRVSISSCANAFSKESGAKFKTSMDENGVRVWRVG